MSRRQRRYFEAYPIKVITDQTIKQILSKAQATRKLAKYSVELGTYNITYEPRNAIKGQVLADFLSEAPVGTQPEVSGAGLALISPNGMKFTYALRLNFTNTNNKAEYKALLARLRMAARMNVQALDVKVDLKLVVSEINGSYVANNISMIKYITMAITKASKDTNDVNHGSVAILSIGNGHPGPLPQSAGGSEVMILAEIEMLIHRMTMIREDENENEIHLNMDLLQERREAATIREAKYKAKMELYYNQRVRLTSFKPDRYVFLRNEDSRVEDQGKLGLKWEGPYRVTEAYQNGSYKLRTMEGREVPRTWHAINL
ncbi:reverse transcriptase domain-containing protein [Tanacetum coccineum]